MSRKQARKKEDVDRRSCLAREKGGTSNKHLVIWGFFLHHPCNFSVPLQLYQKFQLPGEEPPIYNDISSLLVCQHIVNNSKNDQQDNSQQC